LRTSLIFLAWLLCTRPAAALLCGTFLSPMTVSATNLSFGTYAPGSTVTANTSVTIKCGLGLDLLPDFDVRLSAGNTTSPATRHLKLGSSQLYYNIYADPGFGSVWGDGSAGSVLQSYDGLLSLGNISFTGFGRLPSGQYVPAGAYGDHITVTVIY
jgi:spore coat protein U-like protein